MSLKIKAVNCHRDRFDSHIDISAAAYTLRWGEAIFPHTVLSDILECRLVIVLLLKYTLYSEFSLHLEA